MSIIENMKVEADYINEIEVILKKVENLLKNEQRYNYELSEAHTEVENELKCYINKNNIEDYIDETESNIDIMSTWEKAKKLSE
ncbi:hypothetical protein ABEY57_08315 [Bacillus tropicus]|uniref:hypothetical protein n=1 Tax=Bacillus tropicus TaxID=2026188 RepID=UPI003D2419A8